MLFPHITDILAPVAPATVVACILMLLQLTFFTSCQKSLLSLFSSFLARESDASLFLSALHFLRASLNCDLLLSLTSKTAPDRSLPQDRHRRKASLALACSSFTQSFKPGTCCAVQILLRLLRSHGSPH